MSSLSETMATNEKMRAWLERSIEELTSGDWLEATGKREEAIRLPQSDDSPECAVPSWPSDDARQHARARSPLGASRLMFHEKWVLDDRFHETHHIGGDVKVS
jgi:hypothetical protein